jgi:hypothetical protein
MNAKKRVLERFGTLTETAKAVGMKKSTLASAVKRGDVETGALAYGERVIDVESAQRYADSERQPGPKARAKA